MRLLTRSNTNSLPSRDTQVNWVRIGSVFRHRKKSALLWMRLKSRASMVPKQLSETWYISRMKTPLSCFVLFLLLRAAAVASNSGLPDGTGFRSGEKALQFSVSLAIRSPVIGCPDHSRILGRSPRRGASTRGSSRNASQGRELFAAHFEKEGS